MDKLFDVEPIHDKPMPERIGAMYRIYGRTEGRRCKACAHFYWRRSGSGKSKWGKCDLNEKGSLAGTDWSSRWPACGKWREVTFSGTVTNVQTYDKALSAEEIAEEAEKGEAALG